jgi:chaperone required for assembly of F1-ATPase
MTKTETEDERLQRLSKGRAEKPLPKRFYKDVQVSKENRILLDGRSVKTPLKAVLQLPNRRLADAVAAEWTAQADVINPALMPLTKLANTAIDRATSERIHVVNEIVQYAASDLVLYRADKPEKLVSLQQQHWNPVLDWAQASLDAKFESTAGIVHKTQDERALSALRANVETRDPWRLTAIYLLTTLSGSALLALMLEQNAATPEAIWSAAHVDEDFQVSQWGEDWEARLRRDGRRREFDGLVQFLSLLD